MLQKKEVEWGGAGGSPRTLRRQDVVARQHPELSCNDVTLRAVGRHIGIYHGQIHTGTGL